MTPLADAVDERRDADALLLLAQVAVERQQLGVDVGNDGVAKGDPLGQIPLDGVELVVRSAPDRVRSRAEPIAW